MDSRLKEFTLTKVGMGAGMTMGEGMTIPDLCIFSKSWGHEYNGLGKEQIYPTDAICSFLNLLYSPRNIEKIQFIHKLYLLNILGRLDKFS